MSGGTDSSSGGDVVCTPFARGPSSIAMEADLHCQSSHPVQRYGKSSVRLVCTWSPRYQGEVVANAGQVNVDIL